MVLCEASVSTRSAFSRLLWGIITDHRFQLLAFLEAVSLNLFFDYWKGQLSLSAKWSWHFFFFAKGDITVNRRQ